jgi:hypothetical protein
MLLNAKALMGYNVAASDAPAGEVKDAFFDDDLWIVRHLLVDTRAWLRGREVLIDAKSVARVDTGIQKLDLSVTQKQVDESPSIETVGVGRSGAELRSVREVIGCHISARDDTFGHVEDLLIDLDGWAIRYLLVDTRNWWPGPPVLLGVEWANEVDWKARTLSVDMEAERIKACPPYDPGSPVSREYETDLHQHYGREVYWPQRDARPK